MNKTQEALKLIKAHEESGNIEDLVAAYNACKEALEQPEQEPVAWISVKDRLPDVGVEVLTYDTHHEKKYFLNSIIIDKVDKFYFNGFTHWMPLPSAPNEINTHPAPPCQECENLKHDLEGYMDANKALINREWQGLSDDEKKALHKEHRLYIPTIEKIEAMLKEKNHVTL